MLNNLAALDRRQARFADAEPLFQRALAIFQKVGGPEQPAVATLLNNLGQLDRDLGRDADAEAPIKRSLAIREKVLGADHPDVARSLNNLAGLYGHQQRYADAEPLYRRALAIRERVLGPDHPDVATSTSNLACFLYVSGRVADALPLAEKTLASDRAQLRVVLPILFAARQQSLLPDDKAPDYASLSNPLHLTVKDVQPLLSADEAMVLYSVVDKRSYVIAITRESADWKEILLGAEALAQKVTAFRRGLDVGKARDSSGKSGLFDLALANELHVTLLGPVEALIKDKRSLLTVPSGALTALPFHLLVTETPQAAIPDTPEGYRSAAWLLRRQAVSVLAIGRQPEVAADLCAQARGRQADDGLR